MSPLMTLGHETRCAYSTASEPMQGSLLPYNTSRSELLC